MLKKHVPVVRQMVPEVSIAADVIVLVGDAKMIKKQFLRGKHQQAARTLEHFGIFVAILVGGQLFLAIEAGYADVTNETHLNPMSMFDMVQHCVLYVKRLAAVFTVQSRFLVHFPNVFMQS